MTRHDTSWRRVPLSRRLALHPRSGRSGSVVRALAGASDWRRDLLDRFGSGLVLIAGTPALPAAPPLTWPAMTWEELDDELATTLPGLHLIGAVCPRQAGRARLSLLGRMTGNLVVVKLGRADDGIAQERHALQLLAHNPLPGISTPDPVAAGTIRRGETMIEFLVTSAIALKRQRAAIDEPLRTFEHDLASRLAELPRPDGDHALVPVHGDLTPWNLRRTPRGLALFDWEAAGWGASGTDLANYRAASDAIRRPWAARSGDGARP